MKTMLEPRMVAARTQGPLLVAGCPDEPASMEPSSQGVLAIAPTIHPRTDSNRTSWTSELLACGFRLARV